MLPRDPVIEAWPWPGVEGAAPLLAASCANSGLRRRGGHCTDVSCPHHPHRGSPYFDSLRRQHQEWSSAVLPHPAAFGLSAWGFSPVPGDPASLLLLLSYEAYPESCSPGTSPVQLVSVLPMSLSSLAPFAHSLQGPSPFILISALSGRVIFKELFCKRLLLKFTLDLS